jgi:hypothetical protein
MDRSEAVRWPVKGAQTSRPELVMTLPVRHEALLVRTEVRDRRRLAVVAVG